MSDARNTNGADTMTKDQILALECVTSSSDWTRGGHDRTYLTLAGDDRGRGCRSWKIYWDNNRDELVIQEGSGRYPYDFRAALKTISDAVGADICV
jgi:hypothetical protein